jgi:hypothetical protein
MDLPISDDCFFFHYSCFISHAEVFWGTFLAPILAIMLFNLFIFVWVIVVVIRHKRSRVAQKQETVSTRTILRMIFSITGVMFLFGLTWLFAILLFTGIELRSISQLLFTIFNSLQGFFIFIFILNTEAVGLWKKLLGCGSKQSSKSRSTESTQKKLKHSSSQTQSGYVSDSRRTSEIVLIERSTERKVSTIKMEETIIESQMEEVHDQIKEDLSLLQQQ